MPTCKCCYQHEVPTQWDLCSDCQEKVEQDRLIWVNHICPECRLSWCGYFSPDNTPENHSKLSCMQIQTRKIDPDAIGGKVTLRCSICGSEGWVTKNIDFIGARGIFWLGEGEECDCPPNHFEPVLTNPEKYKEKE